MKTYIAVSFLIALSGCASMNLGTPGSVQEIYSPTDGSKIIYMQPAWVNGIGSSPSFKLGLQKTSAMPKSEVIVSFVSTEAVTVLDGNPMIVNVDGEKFELQAMDGPTGRTFDHLNHKVTTASSKMFRGSLELIRKMTAAKAAYIKVQTTKGPFEGEFSKPGMTTAKNSVGEFIVKAEAL